MTLSVNRIVDSIIGAGDAARIMIMQLLFGALGLIALLSLYFVQWGLPHGVWRAAIVLTVGWFAAFIVGLGRSQQPGIMVMTIASAVAAVVLCLSGHSIWQHGVWHSNTMLLLVAVFAALLAAMWPLVDEYVDR